MKESIPVVTTLITAWIFTILILLSSVELPTPPITPYEEPPATESPSVAYSTAGPYYNMLIFMILVIIGGLMMYFIYVYRRVLLKYIARIVIFLGAFSVFTLYNIFVLILFQFALTEYLIYVIAFFEALIITTLIFYSKGFIQMLSAVIFGSAIGSYLGASLQAWSTILIMIMLSIYDIIVVYKGFVGKMMRDIKSLNGGNEFKGFVIESGNIMIGMGDIIFYSLMQSFAIVNYGLIPALGATTGIIIGFLMTIEILKRTNKPTPGLPITLILAILFTLSIKSLT